MARRRPHHREWGRAFFRGRIGRRLAKAVLLGVISIPIGASAARALDAEDQRTASAADQSSLAALIGKPVSGDDDQPVGTAWDVILNPPGKPRLLVIRVRDSARLLAVAFSAIGYHAERGVIHVTGVPASELLSRADFSYAPGMVTLNPHRSP